MIWVSWVWVGATYRFFCLKVEEDCIHYLGIYRVNFGVSPNFHAICLSIPVFFIAIASFWLLNGAGPILFHDIISSPIFVFCFSFVFCLCDCTNDCSVLFTP